jgi:hypothetical protein
MPKITERIIESALRILEAYPNGLRYTELNKKILDENPSFNYNTVRTATWDLDVKESDKVFKPDRGIFKLLKFRDSQVPTTEKPTTEKPERAEVKTLREEDFYKPFAEWIVKELEECTKAIHLGGNKFKDKWGTPDVIGVRKSRSSDILKLPTEIISAEIKFDIANLIAAFGQACAYKIFSHKSYIVIPKQSPVEDIARLDTLGRLFGIGVILYDNTNKEIPDFEIRARASKHEPDMFYVNRYLKLIEDELFD